MVKFNILDIIFPPTCIFCNKKIYSFNKEYSICIKCEELLNSYTIKHNDVIPTFLNGVYKFYSVLNYKDEIREAIINYKFKDELWLGKYFGKILYDYININNGFRNIEVLTYIPINNKTRAKRGYDQTFELSKVISELSQIKLVDCFKKDDKIKENAAHNKSRIVRLSEKKYSTNENIKYVKNKNVLLIDDVLTTGATVNEVVNLLNINGANQVSVAVLATGRRDL